MTNATTNTVELKNITWTTDRYSDGTYRAYAWQTTVATGETIAEADGTTAQEALRGLHGKLCRVLRKNADSTLVSSNGDKLSK